MRRTLILLAIIVSIGLGGTVVLSACRMTGGGASHDRESHDLPPASAAAMQTATRPVQVSDQMDPADLLPTTKAATFLGPAFPPTDDPAPMPSSKSMLPLPMMPEEDAEPPLPTSKSGRPLRLPARSATAP
ncbi:MAG: hypothetical protein RLZZ127_1760 [Planctomycetota bacterium]|jgi:hypothetical protein